jgi:hypothetical protein
MNFTILTPGENLLNDDKSSTVDGRFGGHREHSNTSKEQDYTSRTGTNKEKKENPVDETIRDIDDMTDPFQRKREFSRREETSNVQKSNEEHFITKTDAENRPNMDEGTDPVRVPDTDLVKRHRKPNQWHLSTESIYESEIS